MKYDKLQVHQFFPKISSPSFLPSFALFNLQSFLFKSDLNSKQIKK